jgi:lipoprotein-anchoring transpeptidase ErfK/SrfK
MDASSLPWRSSRTSARPRVLTIAALCAVVLLLLAGAMYLYDHSRRDVIANGVRIGGMSVGGLHPAAALARVRRQLTRRLEGPIAVVWGGRRWTLTPREAGLTLDLPNMVDQALAASREGSIFSRTVRGLFGGRLHRDIPIAVSYSHHAVGGLTAEVRDAVNRAPLDATVQPSATGLRKVPARDGIRVDSDSLGARINAALTGAAPSRTLEVPIHTVKPAVGVSQLVSRYPAYIIIDRADFRLRFYQHLKLADTYEIAVGMEGLETPAGLHHIEWKQVDPPWYVPNKAWAGALAGTVVPPGPGDPLKARFMSFEGGAGIHGIDPSEYETIGHDASHGCVRMRIPDVIALYSRTPVGTPVYIA